MNANVLIIIKTLLPNIDVRFSEEQLEMYIGMAEILIDDTLEGDKRDLGVALIVLDMITTPEVSNLGKNKIGDVEVVYYRGAYTSKWKKMYEDLIDGVLSSDMSLKYIGI